MFESLLATSRCVLTPIAEAVDAFGTKPLWQHGKIAEAAGIVIYYLLADTDTV